MDGWECIAGSTVLIPSYSGHHLHVVISDPAMYEGYKEERCLLVGITTVNECAPYDRTCTLEDGDHEFINRTSYAFYYNAKFLSVDSIYTNIKSGAFVPKKPISKDILQKLADGFYRSDRTKRKYKKLKRAE